MESIIHPKDAWAVEVMDATLGIVMVDVKATGRDRRKVPAPPVSSSSSEDDDNKEEEEPADPNVYMVEAIQGQRTRQGRLEYLVKWENYPKEDNTWEPATGLFCYDLIEEFKKTSKQRRVRSEGKRRKSVKVQVSGKTGGEHDSGAELKKDRQEGETQKEDNRSVEPAKASDKKPTGSTEKKESEVIGKPDKITSEVGKVDKETFEGGKVDKKTAEPIQKTDKKASKAVGKTEKKGSELSQRKDQARPARQDEPLPGPSHRLDRDPRRGASSPEKKELEAVETTKPGRNGLVRGWRVKDIIGMGKEEGAGEDADFFFAVTYKGRDDKEAIPRVECNKKIPHKVIKYYETNLMWAPRMKDD
ncbi:heterochromatin protein 1 [Folsomia candida]|uniref:Heterochromatin protein 1 n=1 Tax=Folsomia candida TaxID=158441 RepID=A0A226DIU9_FOLCA|nr:heterochromatin protein 1 [Folsomia candida]OXA45465.1 Heterochromatin protein 1 [Folsomia candida]